MKKLLWPNLIKPPGWLTSSKAKHTQAKKLRLQLAAKLQLKPLSLSLSLMTHH